VRAYMGHVQDNAEESVRRVIDRLRDGRFSYEMDSGARIEVGVSVDRAARSATVDFTGTSPQQSGNYNAPRSICDAVVLYVFRTMVGADIPLNQGCLKPLEIIVPEGSMLNPVYPAAVIAGNTEVSQAACNALYGALGVIERDGVGPHAAPHRHAPSLLRRGEGCAGCAVLVIDRAARVAVQPRAVTGPGEHECYWTGHGSSLSRSSMR